MIEVVASIEGISKYGQSRPVEAEKKPKELHKDFEERTWLDKAHINDDGFMVIPAMAIKNCLSDAAKYLSVQIPGKGKATYTKHFEAGVLCLEDAVLNVNKEQIQQQRQFVPADGRRGGSTRVWKSFPVIPPHWKAEFQFLVLDHTITEDVFRAHLEQAGNFIGLGWFRPRNNGIYGRFQVESLSWTEIQP